MPVDLAAVRQVFSETFAELMPATAEIVIRADAVLGEAAVLHCRWPLTEKGPYSGDYSREITVQISAAAVNRFREADARARGAMLQKFRNTCQIRLLEEGYNEQDPSPPEFIIHIDHHALEA